MKITRVVEEDEFSAINGQRVRLCALEDIFSDVYKCFSYECRKKCEDMTELCDVF